MAQDVVTGFLVNDQARGRPVGLGIDGTGALLVSDDAGNTLWRVAAADGSVTEAPVDSDRITAASEAVVEDDAEVEAETETEVETETETETEVESEADEVAPVMPEDETPPAEPAPLPQD